MSHTFSSHEIEALETCEHNFDVSYGGLRCPKCGLSHRAIAIWNNNTGRDKSPFTRDKIREDLAEQERQRQAAHVRGQVAYMNGQPIGVFTTLNDFVRPEDALQPVKDPNAICNGSHLWNSQGDYCTRCHITKNQFIARNIDHAKSQEFLKPYIAEGVSISPPIKEQETTGQHYCIICKKRDPNGVESMISKLTGELVNVHRHCVEWKAEANLLHSQELKRKRKAIALYCRARVWKRIVKFLYWLGDL